MTDLLTFVAAPAWAYLAIFGLLAFDAMVPVVPIQAIMITAGALTVYGNLQLALVIAVGALGMLAGDSLAFLLGRTAGRRIGNSWLALRLGSLRKRFAHRKTKKTAERFTRGLRKPGPLVLLLCRFVPGGRMAGGYHAGHRAYPIKLFILYDGGASLAWATYAALVGHIGGTAITQSAWKVFAVAAAAAVVFGTAGWVLALFGGRHDDEGSAPAEDGASDEERDDDGDDVTEVRAASTDELPRRSNPTATGR
jgi:membrane-associated protein